MEKPTARKKGQARSASSYVFKEGELVSINGKPVKKDPEKKSKPGKVEDHGNGSVLPETPATSDQD